MKKLKDRFDALQKWRIDEELPPSAELVRCALNFAKEAALLHGEYRHYTSLDAITKIFGSGKPSLRLTRLSAAKLNDHNECDKFAGKEEALNAYIASFCHDGSENANLWWLYAKGSPESVCLTVRANAFKNWMKVIRGKDVLVTDVVYAAVKGMEGGDSCDRRNILGWSDFRIRVKDLPKFLYRKSIVGRLKDYEWRNESETRIILHRSNGRKYEAVPIPASIIPDLRITISPWANVKEQKRIKKKIVECLSPYGWRPTRQNLRASVLTKAMNALRKTPM